MATTITQTDRSWLPANSAVPLTSIDDGLHRDQIALTQRAVAVGLYRFDASDLMSPEIGLDAFFYETPEWFSDPASLDSVLALIESARVEGRSGYQSHLLGASVSIDDSGLVLVDFATYPSQVVLASNTRSSEGARALSIRRVAGWRTSEEATQISPKAPASIDPRDIDDWIARNDIVELGRDATTIAGLPMEVRTVRVDPQSDLGEGICPFDERPCLWPLSLSDGAEPPVDTQGLNPFSSRRPGRSGSGWSISNAAIRWWRSRPPSMMTRRGSMRSRRSWRTCRSTGENASVSPGFSTDF